MVRIKVKPLALSALAAGSLALGGCSERAKDSAAPTAISGTWERTPEDWFGADPDNPVLPGGAIALKEPYAAQYEALKKKKADANQAGTPIATTSSRCLPEGMPTVMAGLFPIEIFAAPKEVVVLGEYLQQIRRIWLNDKPVPAGELQPSFQGSSTGRWDGDTLIVETQGVRSDALFYDVPHSAGMRITERIRLKAPDLLENQVVIDDPEVLNKPYRFTFEYKRSSYKIQEYVCENNQIAVDSEGKAHWNSPK